MPPHTPYTEILKHPPDFLVEYRIFNPEEGGRESGPPSQGIRWDFWYEHKDHTMKGIFMIWPEFIDDNGKVILYKDKRVPLQGIANMWIINEKLRKYHQDRITVGTVGYCMEAINRTAICKVIKVVGLMTT